LGPGDPFLNYRSYGHPSNGSLLTFYSYHYSIVSLATFYKNAMNHTFIKILTEINANLDRKNRWEKSKLRYYLREVLEEPPQKRGKESTYSDLTLNKLLFISKLMDSNLSPSIRQLKEILLEVSDEEVTRIAEGTERLEIGVPDFDGSGMPGVRTIKGEFLPDEDPSVGRILQTSLQIDDRVESRMEDPKDSAADYMKKQFTKSIGNARHSKWQSVELGPDLEIRYRRNLTKQQEKQLKLAGELLRSIVSEED
jgi:hypothetical protein